MFVVYLAAVTITVAWIHTRKCENIKNVVVIVHQQFANIIGN